MVLPDTLNHCGDGVQHRKRVERVRGREGRQKTQRGIGVECGTFCPKAPQHTLTISGMSELVVVPFGADTLQSLLARTV